jgi:hypothetical protein
MIKQMATAPGSNERLYFLGAENPPRPTISDPVAAKILSRGESLAPRAGRADDFSWPQRSDTSAVPELSQEPVPAAPNPPQRQGIVGKSDSNSQDKKKEVKEKQATQSRASARLGRRGYYNYYPGHWQRGPGDQ